MFYCFHYLIRQSFFSGQVSQSASAAYLKDSFQRIAYKDSHLIIRCICKTFIICIVLLKSFFRCIHIRECTIPCKQRNILACLHTIFQNFQPIRILVKIAAQSFYSLSFIRTSFNRFYIIIFLIILKRQINFTLLGIYRTSPKNR